MKKILILALQLYCVIPFVHAQTGNVGINTITPQARVHVLRNGTSGGPLLTNALAIFEDDQSSFIHFSHVNNAESGLISGNQNTSIRSAMIFGTDSSVFFRAGGNFTRAYINQNGNFGINTIAPAARLHTVRNGSSGGPKLSNALAIFEDNQSSFIHLSHLNTAESGILSGNQSTLVRSGLIFGSDSSVLFRAGGNVNRMVIKNSHVGINTISPVAFLHVNDGDVVFTGDPDLPLMPGPPPVSGQGTRMMWYPDKAAFRAGYVQATQWDKDSIGEYSTAFGSSPKAKGFASVAMGDRNAATGYTATATGGFTLASGDYSTATGCNNQSIGWGSFTMGNINSAVGDMSLAVGYQTKAKPFASLVLGRFNDTTAISTTLWNVNDPVFIIGVGLTNATRRNAMTVMKNGRTGINTSVPLAMLHVKDSSVVFTATGTLPASPGNPPVSGGGSRMMWYPDKAAFRAGLLKFQGTPYWDKDSIGSGSIALGYNVKAKGSTSFAFGTDSEALGVGSGVLGVGAKATGQYAIAIGRDARATGGNSNAIGYGANATGMDALAMGYYSVASGQRSTAMGDQTIASGHTASSMGYQTKANSYASFAIGRYNDTTSVSANSWSLNDPVFIIGNGTSDVNRKNAFTVLKNGNTGINTHAPATLLHVRNGTGGNMYQTNADAIIEDDDATYLQFSSPTVEESGILSGNEVSSVRSGLIFRPDSSVQIRAGGNTTKLFIRKDGNTGIGTLSPQRLLHVSGGASGATATSSAVGVFEDNTDASINIITPNADESAVYFGNPANAVHGGIVYNSTVANGLSFRTNGNVTRAVITDTGDMGLGDNSPNAKLHISKGVSGSTYNSSSAVVIEDDAAAFLQFASPSGSESGILSGTESISLRSGIVFRPDSSVQIRAGGNTTKLVVTKTGNTGIGTLTPEAKLDVNGTAIIGTNGTALTEIIKVTVLSDVPNVAANSTVTETIPVANSITGSSVSISPASALANGLIIAYARVSVAGTVEVKFTNTTGADINPSPMNFYITVIR